MSQIQQGLTQEVNPLSKYSLDIILPFRIVQRPQKKVTIYQRDGHWNEKQHLKYAIFLTYFSKLFEDPPKKKYIRVYQMMADMIITRNANQCRSHHQKMEKYRASIPNIISSVAQKYEPRVYKELEAKYLVFVKSILENQGKYIRDLSKSRKAKGKLEDLPQHESKSYAIENESQVCKDRIAKPLEHDAQISKDKMIVARTADSYSEKHENEHGSEEEQVAVMRMDESVSSPSQAGEDEVEPSPCYQNMNFYYQPNLVQNGLYSIQAGLQPYPQGKEFYQNQIKMLEMRREIHVQNAQILSGHLAVENQLIQQYDQSLQLYRLAFTPTFLL